MPSPRYRLWIDGVGCWNLSFGSEWTIGGPGLGADLEMLAPLDATTAVLFAKEDRFEATVGSAKRRLSEQDSLEWDSGVMIGFRKPHPWSDAATLRPASSHRPVDHADGLILGAGPCVLGPDADSHVVCSEWPYAVVLFERHGRLCWKRLDGPLDGNPVNLVGPDSLIETEEIRLSIEQLA